MIIIELNQAVEFFVKIMLVKFYYCIRKIQKDSGLRLSMFVALCMLFLFGMVINILSNGFRFIVAPASYSLHHFENNFDLEKIYN